MVWINSDLCTVVPKSSANCRPRWEKRILVFGERGAARALATHWRTTPSLACRSPDISRSRRFWYNLPLSWGSESKSQTLVLWCIILWSFSVIPLKSLGFLNAFNRSVLCESRLHLHIWSKCILFKFCGGKAEFSAAITPVFSVTLSFRDNFFSLLLILKTVMFNVPSKLRNKPTHRT